MKDNYTHIVVVLDSSGSMATIYDDTLAGFNHFLKTQKETDGEATMTLVEFNHDSIHAPRWPIVPLVNPLGGGGLIGGVLNVMVSGGVINPNIKLDFVPIKKVKDLNKETYVPNGGTPLLDTIGETIVRTGRALLALPEALRPSKVLFVIITDGEENASRYYDLEKIKEMTTHQTDVYKWEFLYLGANQDAIKVGTAFGMKMTNSMSYGLSGQEIGATYRSLSTKTSAFRSAKTVDDAINAVTFTEEERKSAKNN
jgi:hypothetical protein